MANREETPTLEDYFDELFDGLEDGEWYSAQMNIKKQGDEWIIGKCDVYPLNQLPKQKEP